MDPITALFTTAQSNPSMTFNILDSDATSTLHFNRFNERNMIFKMLASYFADLKFFLKKSYTITQNRKINRLSSGISAGVLPVKGIVESNSGWICSNKPTNLCFILLIKLSWISFRCSPNPILFTRVSAQSCSLSIRNRISINIAHSFVSMISQQSGSMSGTRPGGLF